MGLILAVLLSGCAQQQESATVNDSKIPTLTSTPTPILTPTPTPAESIIINVSPRLMSSIGSYNIAPAGKVYLVFTLEIENKGYVKFNTNPNYWKFAAQNVEYSYSPATFSLANKLETVDILDGGKVKGDIAFEIPAGLSAESQIRLSYQGLGNYNVVWK